MRAQLEEESKVDDLRGKIFVVTGAASGLGCECARRLGQAGAMLVLADLDRARLASVADELRTRGADVQALVVDVRLPDDCAAMAQRALDSFGALNGAVCSAGIDNVAPPLELSLQTWQNMLDVNLTGTFLSVQATARAMVQSGNRGALVTFASGIAVRGRATGAHYAASKAGVIAMSKSVALDVARHGIRINIVAPGITETPMMADVMTPTDVAARARQIPLGRIGQPDDIAKVVAFLLSDASGWLTGQTIHPNGGALMP
jgi:NAD(P)-dependent dehydrogenase (short-subunit alcohol dehydrogenase family)